jgi:AcrR family transcriptional regulator
MAMADRPGLRERKRQETLERITAAGLKLFAAQGYEATTLDAIAAEAGISRRTFFHYFKSKDDILISMQSGLGKQLAAELARRKPGPGAFAGDP